MKLIPGVVEDPSGGLHFHGGAEDQTRYTLNGFDITDPIDNRFSTRLAVEGVREVNLTSARESPQLGGGSAGTLAIQTDNGTDKLQYTATNFIPGVDTRGGLHFGDWTPRAGISGPIVKGRAWFSDSFDGEYSSGIITGLPSGQDSNQLWAAGNLFHTQVNLTPADILYADLLTNFDHQAHSGLGVLDPDSTTQALTDREFMTGVKENHSWAGGSMLETGFAWLDVYHRSIPMGDSLYLITPEGRSGNYFQVVYPDRAPRPALRQFLPPGVAPQRSPPAPTRRRCPAPGLFRRITSHRLRGDRPGRSSRFRNHFPRQRRFRAPQHRALRLSEPSLAAPRQSIRRCRRAR